MKKTPARLVGEASDRNACARAMAVAALAATIALSGVPAVAGSASDDLSVKDAWMRLIVPSRPAAGYFTLSNEGDDDAATLVGASSPGCGSLTLHRSVSQGGTETMEMVNSIPVAADASVEFAPGGYHLMCMQPTADLASGKSVDVTLKFQDGRSLSASFAVKNARGE